MGLGADCWWGWGFCLDDEFGLTSAEAYGDLNILETNYLVMCQFYQ